MNCWKLLNHATSLVIGAYSGRYEISICYQFPHHAPSCLCLPEFEYFYPAFFKIPGRVFFLFYLIEVKLRVAQYAILSRLQAFTRLGDFKFHCINYSILQRFTCWYSTLYGLNTKTKRWILRDILRTLPNI